LPSSESSGLFSGGWTGQINGDGSKARADEGGSNNMAHLPPENYTQCQVNLPKSIREDQAPSSDAEHYNTSAPSCVYPRTSSVNPTIVLLQHNRGTLCCGILIFTEIASYYDHE
ncbi:hypothetical protein GOODEAATRI_028868, partial [Goodea atripinnis]